MMKKLLSAMASLALLTGACAMPVSAEETYLLGDVNADGVVDVRDAQRIVGYFNRAVILNTEHMWTEEQYAAADVNADGVVDTSDAACVLDYCVKRIITKGSQNSDIYFAKAAAGVEDYSLGDVNMDGVVDVVDYVEVRYAYMTYTGMYQDVTESHWTEAQYALANVTDRYNYYTENGVEIKKGIFNAYDEYLLFDYCIYTVIVEDSVEPEEYFQNPQLYLTVEMLEAAHRSEETSAELDQLMDTIDTLYDELRAVYGQQRSV